MLIPLKHQSPHELSHQNLTCIVFPLDDRFVYVSLFSNGILPVTHQEKLAPTISSAIGLLPIPATHSPFLVIVPVYTVTQSTKTLIFIVVNSSISPKIFTSLNAFLKFGFPILNNAVSLSRAIANQSSSLPIAS